MRLEAPDEEAADLLLDVGVAVGVAQDRQVSVHSVDLLGDDVEVLGGVQRHGDTDQLPHCLGPLAGTVDDELGLDVALVGAHPARPPGRGEHVGDPHPSAIRTPASAHPWPGPG